MGITLETVKLLELLPDNLKDDVESICFASAFDEIITDAREKTKYIQFFSRVDSLNSDELALLSRELHVDIYDENWSLEQKRTACKNSIKWHIYKGTPWMLENYVVQIYGNSKLEEWFEYGGLSYHFRILVEILNNGLNDNVLEKISQAILNYKNQRSKLDGVKLNVVSACTPPAVPILKSDITTIILSKEN